MNQQGQMPRPAMNAPGSQQQQLLQQQAQTPTLQQQQLQSQQPLSLLPTPSQPGQSNMLQQQQQHQDQQSVATPTTPALGTHNVTMSPAPIEATAPLLASPSAASDQGMLLMQQSNSIVGTPVIGTPQSAAQIQANAQAYMMAQQAMQFKHIQGQQQQQQQQPMQQQPMQPGVNQPQLAQYLSGLFPHQLAHLSNQQRMNLLAMRQLQQHHQQQQQQFPNQLNGPNLLNQQAMIQALQQNIMAGNGSVGVMNGFSSLGPASSPQQQQQQQMLAAQLAQNANNQQLLNNVAAAAAAAAANGSGQNTNQTLPRPQQPNLNQMQFMRIRQAMQQQVQQQQAQQQAQQQQQAMNGGVQRIFSMPPASQPASSPVMMNLSGSPAMSAAVQGPGSPAMSAPALNNGIVGNHSFPLNVQMGTPQQAMSMQPMGVQHANMSPSMTQQAVMSPSMGLQAHPQRPPLTPQMMQSQQRPPVTPQTSQQLLQQSPSHIPTPLAPPGMQPQQQAMMLAAAAAAGLSPSDAQALLAQIAANADATQQHNQHLQSLQNSDNNTASGSPTLSTLHVGVRPTGMPLNQQPHASGNGAVPGSNVGSGVVTPGTPASGGNIGVRPPSGMASASASASTSAAASPHGKQLALPRPNRPVRPVARPPAARTPLGTRTPGTPTGGPRPRPSTPVNAQQQPRRPPPSAPSGSAKGSTTPAPSTPASRASTPNSPAAKSGPVRAHPLPPAAAATMSSNSAASAMQTPRSGQPVSTESTPAPHNRSGSPVAASATPVSPSTVAESSQAEGSVASQSSQK
ncbi:hypothetical protein LPJ66_009643 [Kickxella alabastrina]|uniref:Uncharacterized protein n=1 Tax=Kickxella alabastrina TaxID=61397 RepID=A0ACC1IAP5_9FUNG|nr:hypothetical protein LPJ66_009643 [Kickxella alabastrina]